MKLRLLLTEKCYRNCEGCCNKQWDLKKLEVASTFEGYDEIILTGGEPMLFPDKVYKVTKEIREQTDAKIFLYTAKVDTPSTFHYVMFLVDGITVTLHDGSDIWPFHELNSRLSKHLPEGKSMRLNVFEGVNILGFDLSLWKVKKNIKWIDDCPLPIDEEFKRYGK